MATKAIRRVTATTSEILNNIRADQGSEYLRRIPYATAGNLSEIAEIFANDSDIRNRIIPSMLNKIALTMFKEAIWTNPYNELKIGLLRLGELIEEVHTNLIQAYRFNPQNPEVHSLGYYEPDTAVFYYPALEPRIYPVTLNDNDFLRRGFQDESSLTEYFGSIMNSLTTSAQYDDYLLVNQYIKEFSAAHNAKLFKVQIPDINATGLDSDQRKDAIMTVSERIRAVADTITLAPSNLYNPAGRDAISTFSDLIIFTTPEFAAALDVRVLAWAYNEGRADVQPRIIKIAQMPIPGVPIILMDKRTLLLADREIATSSQWNAASFTTNHFLKHSPQIGISRCSNIVLFTLDAGTTIPTISYTVSGVTVDPVDTSGWSDDLEYFSVPLSAVVAGTSTPTGISIPQGVKWSITGIGYGAAGATSITTPGYPVDGTQISPSGQLMIGANQLSSMGGTLGTNVLLVSVKAVSVIDGTTTGTLLIEFPKALA